MKKIAQGIVRFRKLILTVAFLLLIPSAIGAVATRINYDILTYLPQDLDSMIGEVALEDDFHLASTGMITVEGLPTNELIAMKKEIEAVPGVTQTFWLSDVIDPSIPTAMLPADVQQFMFGKNDSTMLIVRFDAPSASDETMEAVKQIEKLLRKDCFFGGMSVILQDTKALVNQEMPLYILIAVGASLLVLFLSLESTITPLLFMLGLLFPIAYNFGTNIFLGQISYITEALATVLQLGVTMDFSIFLLHRYQEEKELRSTNEEAMVSAICKTMTSISASSLTTIAGFLALCAMQLTLGRDIGVVMAKGVALGVVCTIVILPALILFFDKWVEKYRHRTFIPKLTRLSHFVSGHPVGVLIASIAIIIPFALAQGRTSVYYALFDALPQDMPGIVGVSKLGEDFGMVTNHFILVHDDLPASKVSALCDDIGELDGILCPAHPAANPENGVAHACGHNAQLTALVGAALALSAPGVAEALSGSVAFFAVPAEEYVPIGTRQALQKQGVEFCCGKSELLRTGGFDGVDLALTTHVHMIPCESDLLLGNVACNGFTSKTVVFHGKAAHAATAPHAGVNALNAAALALNAVGLLRETFRECDTVRIHTNIREGGAALNVVPETVVMEAMVRAATLEALDDAARKFDRACTHAAEALGAHAEILTYQGYMPVRPAPADPALLAAAAALPGLSAQCAEPGMQNIASTDVGDLSQVMPVVNFTHGGTAGALHSADFAVTDVDKAYIAPAKMMALTAYHLLKDGAVLARRTMDGFTPVFTRESYIETVRRQG